MRKIIIVLAILIIGYGAVVLHYLHDCRRGKYMNKDISGEKYIDKDIGRGEDDGST